jgi:hypothetical protein
MYESKYEEFALKFSNEYPEIKTEYETKNIDTIENILNIAIPEFGEYLALDIYDSGNFDTIEKTLFDKEKRILTFIWYETLPQIDKKNRKYGHRTSLDIQIASMYIYLFQGIPLIFLRGYYLNKKETNKYYNHGSSDVSIRRDGNLTMEIFRIYKKYEEFITVPILNLYSIAIIPKTTISTSVSRRFVNSVNAKMITAEFNVILERIDSIDKNEVEELENYGNCARKNMERALKFIAIVNGINYSDKNNQKGELQSKMLGDLVKPIISIIGNKDVESSLIEAIELLNYCSHDHGQYIKKNDIVNGVKKAKKVIEYIFTK